MKNTKNNVFRLVKINYFEDTIDVDDFIENISDKEYSIVAQVLNYNNKIIGLMITNKDITDISSIPIFLPIRPSKLLDDFEIKTIDDDIWRNYNVTTGVLKKNFY